MSMIRDVFALPSSPPNCVVEIRNLDEADESQRLLDEFVLTPELRRELLGGPADRPALLPRMRASVKQHAPGDGHWVHGSFGSGKSHFMSVLGLLLANPSVACRHQGLSDALTADDRAWLAENRFLSVPVFMLGADNLERQTYTAINECLDKHEQPPCPFYDVEASLALFDTELASYGEIAFEKRLVPIGVDRRRYDELRSTESGRFELAALVRQAFKVDQLDDARGLYPKDMATGMVILSQHATRLGYAGVLLLIDELILYLRTKTGQTWEDEIARLGGLVDDKSGRACPVWVVVARQRDIRETKPSDLSESYIHEALQRLSDRFPYETRLEDCDLVPIVRERVLRPRDQQGKAQLASALDRCLAGLDDETRHELAGQWGEQALRALYPFHPALLQTLVDLGNQLSRERTALWALYQLLIVRHPELPLGQMVPYHSVFDVVLPKGGLLSGGPRRSAQLEAVSKVYYDDLYPIIQRVWADDQSARQRVEVAVKTVLLCQLTRDLSSHITISRIVHLNRADLQTRFTLATYGGLKQLLEMLAHECPSILVRGDDCPDADVEVAISVHEGLSLDSDVLPHVAVTQADVARVFQDLLEHQLGQHFNATGAITAYKHVWRGTERSARVRLANVAELDVDNLSPELEFTLVVDQPYDSDPHRAANADDAAIARAQKQLGSAPVGFWLPSPFSPAEVNDLQTLARLELLSGTTPQADETQKRLLGHLPADERERLGKQILEFRDTKRAFLSKRVEACYMREGARCVFLDARIQPNLDASALPEALSRISKEALDRLHPHHPEFPSLVQSATLQDFLNDVALPMLQAEEPLALDARKRSLVQTVAQPLTLGSAGAERWSLDKNGQYLRRAIKIIDDTTKADDLRADLAAQYGIQDALTDFFILLLIHGFGYRAFREGSAVAQADLRPGKLKGLRLHRGELVSAATWTEAKHRLATAWSAPACRPHLGAAATSLDQTRQANRSVPAQDDLWRALKAAATALREPLKRGRATLNKLESALAGQSLADRQANLSQATEVNNLVLNGPDDPKQALEQLAVWQPPEGTADECLRHVGPAASFDTGMAGLNQALLDLVSAQHERPGAAELLQRLANHANNVTHEGQLGGLIGTWNTDAQAWLKPPPSPVTPEPESEIKPEAGVRERVIACRRADLAGIAGTLRQQAEDEFETGAATVVFRLEVSADDA